LIEIFNYLASEFKTKIKMKKLLLLVAIATLGLSASAQFSMGLKFGANINTVKPAYFTTTSAVKDNIVEGYDDFTAPLTGMNVAFVMNTGGKIFSFQPEFAFSQRGAKAVDANGDLVAKFKANYFDLKPMFNIGGGTDTWRVYSHFGPTINVWLSKKATDKDGEFIKGSDEWATGEEDLMGASETDIRLDVGFVFGAGFKYKLGPGWALINPRYEMGFVPQTIQDLGNDGYGEVNRTFSINFGYLYEF
jgi:hypothetical protein